MKVYEYKSLVSMNMALKDFEKNDAEAEGIAVADGKFYVLVCEAEKEKEEEPEEETEEESEEEPKKE